MMLRRLLAAAGFALAIASSAASATNTSVDVTDIWWPDSEPGWGIQLIHNANTIFATLFVYDFDNQPTFLVAVLEKQPGGDIWSGGLYAAEGTSFASPWNPADRVELQVGTMTFTLLGLGVGTLAYNVGPTSVAKTINRQPLALEDNAGNYRITHTWTAAGAGCTAADQYNPTLGPVSGDLAIQRINGETALVSLTWQHNPLDVCQMTATYTQVGRIGSYTGALSCPTSGNSGTLAIFEVANRVKMFTGRYLMEWGYGCTRTGHLTAIMAQP